MVEEGRERLEQAGDSSLAPAWFKPTIIIGIFVIGVTLATILWPFIKFPFHNPQEVVSALARQEFNPLNNIVRFLVLISLSPLLLALVYALNIGGSDDVLFGQPGVTRRKISRKDRRERRSGKGDADSPPDTDDYVAENQELPCEAEQITPPGEIIAQPDLSIRLSRRSKIILTVLLAFFTVIIALSTPSQSRVIFPGFEPYHDGETLGPATMYLNGQVPYSDFVIIHGLYEDPLRGVLGFKLFGRSIGALWTIETINSMVAITFLVILLYLLFQGNFLYVFLAILALTPFYASYSLMGQLMIPPRDTVLFAFLIVVILLYRLAGKDQQSKWKIFTLGFLCTFVPVASFAYSIDRGFYATITFLILLMLAYPLYFHQRLKHRLLLMLAAVGGTACAMILIGILLKWEYLPFVKFILNYPLARKELIDGLVFPRTFKFYAMCVLVAANTYWLAYRAIRTFHHQGHRLCNSLRAFFDRYMIEFALLLLSIFTFRNALGRPDWGHMLYSVCFSFVLSIYILVKHYLHPLLNRDSLAFDRDAGEKDPPVAGKAPWSPAFKILVVIVVISAIVLSAYQLSMAWERPGYLKAQFPAGTRDSEVVPRRYKDVIENVSPYLQPHDDIVSITNDASWYYLFDKRCPVRFPSVVIGSLPDDQREMVRQLDEQNVKFVVYRSVAWFYDIDDVPQQERLSILYEYIDQNYHTFYSNGYHDIWVSNRCEPKPPLTVVDAGASDSSVFESGWYAREGDPGEGYRKTQKTAVCVMANDPSTRELVLKVGGFPSGAGTASVKVFINGVVSGPYAVAGSQEILRIKKPARVGDELRVQIDNQKTFIRETIFHDKDMRVAGVSVWRIWQE